MPTFLLKFVVHIYMKSGNIIVLKNVKTFDIEKKGCQVTSLSWELYDKGDVQILNINVDEIEGIIAYRKLRLW